MKTLKTLLAAALALLALISAVSCGAQKPANSTQDETPSAQNTSASQTETAPSAKTESQTETSVPETSEPETSEPETEDPTSPENDPDLIIATITSKTNDYEVKESGHGSVKIQGAKKPAAGDTVRAEISGHFLKVKANGQVKAPILFLPDGVFTYTLTSDASVYMDNAFTRNAFNFTFSIPTEKELTDVRNLAQNPYDYDPFAGVYPHASSNNVYDASGQFIARNAIDGYTSNTAHGNYPYESWGPKAVVNKNDHFTVEFGRDVLVSSVELYLRADGFGSSNSHDAYFSEIVLEFSNGTSVTVNPQKIKDKQTFEFDAVTTSYVKLTGFVTDKKDSQGWAAITEVRVMGCEAPALESSR